MNDTPETEVAVIACGGDWSPILCETCRRLERERDEAIKGRNAYKQLAVKHAEERDEAKNGNKNLYKLLKEAINELYSLGNYDLANELHGELELNKH